MSNRMLNWRITSWRSCIARPLALAPAMPRRAPAARRAAVFQHGKPRTRTFENNGAQPLSRKRHPPPPAVAATRFAPRCTRPCLWRRKLIQRHPL